ATASLKLHALDVRAFAPNAPPIRANGEMALVATSTMRGTEIAVVAREQPLEPIVTDPFAKPKQPSVGETIVAVDGKVLLEKDGDIEAVGSVHASLERARLDVDARYGAQKLDAHVKLDAPALSEIRALRLPIRGGVFLDVVANADLGRETFSATGA